MQANAYDRGYRLVRVAHGAFSIRSLAHGETFHPVIGPVAEAEALYVRQLRLRDRLAGQDQPFVVWDIGLGGAANVLTVLRALRELDRELYVVSFDCTLDPLRFACAHAAELEYPAGFEPVLSALAADRRVRFTHGRLRVDWCVHVGDFPALLVRQALAGSSGARAAAADLRATFATHPPPQELPPSDEGALDASAQPWPNPHAIFFDAYSPAANLEMWTLPLFRTIHRLLDPSRACALATYSRSTMLRVTLLLAGFFVGTGEATGEKEQTTVAANTPALIARPLDRAWLARAHRSTSAEPLHTPVYRQARLSPQSWERLQEHPQFR